MKLLVTGFDPFGGASVNPAWEAAQALPDILGPWQICRLRVPTVFGLAAETVIAAAEREKVDAILCVGQAGGRSSVTSEMVGVNLRFAAFPDNAGNLPQDEPVIPGGPAAYFSTLPARKMAEAIREAGLPGAVSYSAGAFVCNDLLYSLLHHFNGSPVRAGFIHVPYLPEQGAPSLPLNQTVRALIAAVSSITR